MAKGFYAVKRPQFTGIVRSNEEYKVLVEARNRHLSANDCALPITDEHSLSTYSLR